MEAAEGNTLTLKDYLRLSETSEVVQAVINDQIKYDTIKVFGVKQLFRKDFKQSEACKKFCEELEVSIESFILYGNAIDSDWKEIRFKNLRTLIVRYNSVLGKIPVQIYQDNVLERIILDFNIEDISSLSITTNFVFSELFTVCESLKILIFICEIPLKAVALNEIFGFLNYKHLGMDEVIFDCYPLPSGNEWEYLCCFIEKIEMEFIRNDGSRKVIVKPLKIRDSQTRCQQLCQVKHHVFRSDSVTEFSIPNFEMKCLRYYQSCFKSFPYIRKIYASIQCTESMLNLLSTELKHLSECTFLSFNNNVRHYTTFPNMKKLKVRFNTMNDERFKQFLRSFPKLRHLDVEILDASFIYDKCVDLIAKHLKDIENLRIRCDKSHLTDAGFYIIGNVLKNLRSLSIFCTEADTNIKQLFVKLRHLEHVQCNQKTIMRDDALKLGSEENSNNSLESDTAAEMHHQSITLPPEVLEKIFLHLGRNDQLTCRMVCKLWFDIFSYNTNLYRTIDFKSCYLSKYTNPVKIFAYTNFHYNRLIFNNDTNFAPNENLRDLWDRIGPSIEEICVDGDATSIIMAFKSGLSLDHFGHVKSLVFETFQSFNLMFLEGIPEWTLLLRQIKKLTFYSYVEVLKLHIQCSPMDVPNLKELRIRDNSQQILECLNNYHSPNITKLLCISGDALNMKLFLDTCKKFTQLRCLFVAKPIKWKNYEIDLISSCCPKLKCLGLCYRTSDFDIRSKFYDFDEILEKNSCTNVAQEMFQKLPSLRDISFVIFSTFGRDSEMYCWSEKALIVTNRFYSSFSDFFKSQINFDSQKKVTRMAPRQIPATVLRNHLDDRRGEVDGWIDDDQVDRYT